MIRKLTQSRTSFQAPILWSVCLGTFFCVLFYALLEFGPVRLSLLERYAKCHAVAYASVEFFFVAVCALIHKSLGVKRQLQLVASCDSSIEEIKIAKSDHTDNDELSQIHWLEAAWKAQSGPVFGSALGVRVRELLSIQTRRKTLAHLDDDLKSLAERDADEQHDSYAMVRIITWAMPMLGFLGTVIGISDTLGQMDAAALASGSQDAMNKLTAGLYVAFDTTAVGLVLTMVVMFHQFSVNKSEIRLLSAIDKMVADLCGSCLIYLPKSPELAGVESAFQNITNRLLQSVESLIHRQAELWQQSMEAIQHKLTTISSDSAQVIEASLTQAIVHAHASAQATLLETNQVIAKTHIDGNTRLAEETSRALAQLTETTQKHQHYMSQQSDSWQKLLKEQAELARSQQANAELVLDRLDDLITNSELIHSMQEPVQQTLHRLTDVDRFHDAAICLTEAVAVLGTQMERYGYIGRQPLRRRVTEEDTNSSSDPPILPMKRKAG